MSIHRQTSQIARESPIATARVALPVSEAGTASRADTGVDITVTKENPTPIAMVIAIGVGFSAKSL